MPPFISRTPIPSAFPSTTLNGLFARVPISNAVSIWPANITGLPGLSFPNIPDKQYPLGSAGISLQQRPSASNNSLNFIATLFTSSFE